MEVGNVEAREAEMWKLINSLQREKEQLSSDARFWQQKFLELLGQPGAGYAPSLNDLDEAVRAATPPIGGPLGRHVSIQALKHKHEMAKRAEAEKLKEKPSDPA